MGERLAEHQLRWDARWMGFSATARLRNMPGLRFRVGVTMTNALLGSPGEILLPGWSTAAKMKVTEVYTAKGQLKQVA